MTYIIVKKTQREREAALAESRARPSSQRNIEGVVRTAEEGFEIARQREREGIPFDRMYQVNPDSAETRQATADRLLRDGVNPETHETLHSESTKHA